VIYFIQDKTTGAIKVGWSKNPKRRLGTLQTATPNELVLLGTVQGGLEHEAGLHDRFAQHRLQGEWFRGTILAEVLQVIARETASPPPQQMNVIVAGDSDNYFEFSTNPEENARRRNLETLVFQSLNEIHSATPIAWIITGGQRLIEVFAWQWASQHKIERYEYYPNWRRYGRGGATQVGQKMLRSMFHPKMLLVFLTGKVSASTQTLIKRANKASIPTVIKALPGAVVSQGQPGAMPVEAPQQ
jgi:hypothetical protein